MVTLKFDASATWVADPFVRRPEPCDRHQAPSRMESMDAGRGEQLAYAIIDCAPEAQWITYPQGRRVGDPPFTAGNIIRCQ